MGFIFVVLSISISNDNIVFTNVIVKNKEHTKMPTMKSNKHEQSDVRQVGNKATVYLDHLNPFYLGVKLKVNNEMSLIT